MSGERRTFVVGPVTATLLLHGLVICAGSLWEMSCPHLCVCVVKGWEFLRLDAKTISCENLTFSSVPENISTEVEVLSLKANAIGHSHDYALVELLHLRRLMMLDLSWNRLRNFRSAGSFLESLRYLNLGYNCLVHVETGSFRSFVNLEYLSLRGNRIGAVSPMAFELPKLKTIDLSDNKLAVIASHFFAELTDLRRLHLSGNHVNKLTEAILTHMNDVELIDLAENKISRIESEAFRFVERIGELRLSDNHLHEIPHQALESAAYLGRLEICRNPLRILKRGSFRNVRVEDVVVCSNRDLSVIERNAFEGMPRVRNITVFDNRNLKFVEPEAFANNPFLESVNLSNNSLYSLREDAVSGYDRLDALILSGNPLKCDCSLRWLQNVFANSSSLSNLDEIRCWLDGQYVSLDSLEPFPAVCQPTVLPIFPETVSLLPSTSLSVHCSASGLPYPTVFWVARNGTPVKSEECCSRIYSKNSVLNVRYLHTEDSGVYTCVAENSLGMDTRSFLLNVKDLNVRIIPVTVTSTYVTLSWNLSSGLANDFVLQYKTPEEDVLCNKTIYVGIKTHSYTLSGLRPGRVYTIWLGIQRDEYVIRLSNVRVRTKEHGFLLMLGIRTNYLSIVLVAGCAGMILTTCICVCGIRIFRWKIRKHTEMVLTDNMSQRGFAKSESATSDLAFMTYVNVADEAVLVGNDDESYE